MHSMLSSLVTGMNEVRASLSQVVTRDDLRALHEAQTAEMQTFVRAETAPLHDGMAQLTEDFKVLAVEALEQSVQVGNLESKFMNLESKVAKVDASSHGNSNNSAAKSGKIEMAHLQVCFKGFSTDTAGERADLIKSFMSSNFP